MDQAFDIALRVGAVSYLNTKPLVYRLLQLAPQIELTYDVPSRLADGLAAGRFDVALIPSIEYLRDPAYRIVSDVCIGCRGPVWSVKLLSRVPMPRITSLALDEGSRTSAVLSRILLKERVGVEPDLRILPIGYESCASRTDAVLLIGDRAIHSSGSGYPYQWDLGQEWWRWSRLPFVFAMWIARGGIPLEGISAALSAARDCGVAELESIAHAEAAAAGLTPARTLEYLRDNLYFYLGPQERRGLQLFYRHAASLEDSLGSSASVVSDDQVHDWEIAG